MRFCPSWVIPSPWVSDSARGAVRHRRDGLRGAPRLHRRGYERDRHPARLSQPGL